MINSDELRHTLVAERQRDLARFASTGRFARLARRSRRQRNPVITTEPQPTHS